MARYRLKGDWAKGLAFDLHTLDSTYLGSDVYGHPQFDTTYSEMGKLLRRLKYDGDQTVVADIVALLDPIGRIDTFDAIVPVPSSKVRAVQPVDAIALALGKRRGVQVLPGFLTKTGNTEMKNVADSQERTEILRNQIIISGSDDLSGCRVLLLDDLYRSGATLNACCWVLKNQTKVEEISVLTMTKTRKNQ